MTCFWQLCLLFAVSVHIILADADDRKLGSKGTKQRKELTKLERELDDVKAQLALLKDRNNQLEDMNSELSDLLANCKNGEGDGGGGIFTGPYGVHGDGGGRFGGSRGAPYVSELDCDDSVTTSNPGLQFIFCFKDNDAKDFANRGCGSIQMIPLPLLFKNTS